MKLVSLPSGALRVVRHNKYDLAVLNELLSHDLRKLPRRLKNDLDYEPEWGKTLGTKSIEAYSSQRRFVIEAVTTALEADEKKMVIDLGEGEAWYGALNQARIAIDEEFEVSKLGNPSLDEINDEDLRFAYSRFWIYYSIQMAVLEEVIGA